jgi:ribosomal protein L15E
VAGCERKRELGRRRSRRAKLNKLKSKLGKATQSEKTEIARKLRNLTPGAEELIDRWKLVESDR